MTSGVNGGAKQQYPCCFSLKRKKIQLTLRKKLFPSRGPHVRTISMREACDTYGEAKGNFNYNTIPQDTED